MRCFVVCGRLPGIALCALVRAEGADAAADMFLHPLGGRSPDHEEEDMDISGPDLAFLAAALPRAALVAGFDAALALGAAPRPRGTPAAEHAVQTGGGGVLRFAVLDYKHSRIEPYVMFLRPGDDVDAPWLEGGEALRVFPATSIGEACRKVSVYLRVRPLFPVWPEQLRDWHRMAWTDGGGYVCESTEDGGAVEYVLPARRPMAVAVRSVVRI